MTEDELNKMRALRNSDTSAQPDAEETEGTDTSTEDSQSEQEVEDDTEEESEGADTSSSQKDVVEEARVPYSRFETVNERAIKAEQEAKMLREQLEANRGSSNQTAPSGDLPGYWVELYGDSDLSRQAWAAEQKRLTAMQESVAQKAVEAVEKRQAENAKFEEDTINRMVNVFDDFGSKNKRTFTDVEQSAILDIMDELSPKDETGRYEVDPVRYLDRAVEIHDLRQVKTSGKRIEAKRKAASLAGASSDGAPQGNEKSGHFVAGNWDSWRNNPLLPKD